MQTGVKMNGARRGFTLIEMLMVIAIIAMLATLSSVAYVKVKAAAVKMGNQIEIDQLKQGIEAYKEQTRDYPPCFGDAEVDRRIQCFIDHLKFAFPNYSPQGSDYASQYAAVKAAVARYQVPNSSVSLNLDNLVLNNNNNSQAEALVFWLSGMPMSIDTTSGGDSNPIGTTKTFGFHTNSYNPFQLEEAFPSGTTQSRRRDVLISKRTQRKFSFDESRLVDLDNDGWWEYVTKGEDSGNDKFKVHPYVYFDYRTYARPGSGAYATSGSANPTNMPGYVAYVRPDASGDPLNDWVVPYAARVATTASSSNLFQSGTNLFWMGDRSFQIICAGLDSDYGGDNSSPRAYPVVKILPNEQSNVNYAVGGYLYSASGDIQAFPTSEDDNQVSFSASTVGEIRLKN